MKIRQSSQIKPFKWHDHAKRLARFKFNTFCLGHHIRISYLRVECSKAPYLVLTHTSWEADTRTHTHSSICTLLSCCVNLIMAVLHTLTFYNLHHTELCLSSGAIHSSPNLSLYAETEVLTLQDHCDRTVFATLHDPCNIFTLAYAML